MDKISNVHYRAVRKVTKSNGVFCYASGRVINLNGRLLPANGGVLIRQGLYPVLRGRWELY